MKKLLLIAFLFVSLSCVSQGIKKTYSKIYTSEDVDSHFSKHYKNYVARYFYSKTGKRRIIERDPVLDTVAAGRSEYSVLVFKESSKNHSFKYLVSNIPDGPRAHKRFYDNPSIFKEPKGCVFPEKDSLSILKRNNLDWSSELFVEEAYSFQSESSSVENKEVLRRYLAYTKKNEESEREDVFLDSYLGSEAHKNAIHKYGNWKFGCSSMFIVAKYYNSDSRMWKYEVFVCHTIIMLKNFTDSNVY